MKCITCQVHSLVSIRWTPWFDVCSNLSCEEHKQWGNVPLQFCEQKGSSQFTEHFINNHKLYPLPKLLYVTNIKTSEQERNYAISNATKFRPLYFGHTAVIAVVSLGTPYTEKCNSPVCWLLASEVTVISFPCKSALRCRLEEESYCKWTNVWHVKQQKM